MLEELKYTIGDSQIHGKGIIVTDTIEKDEVIGVVIHMEPGKITLTEFGSYVNHSYFPNSALLLVKNRYDLVAVKRILPGEEVVADYNFTPSFLKKPDIDFK